jgi:hypothetical protein
MIILSQENQKELELKVLNLLVLTSIEIGHKTQAKSLAALSKIFAADLKIEKRFGKMSFNQVQDAFRIGVRFAEFEPFINIRTFYKWVYAHKKIIDDATYQVETLKQENVLYYQPPIKLLK